VISEKVIKEAFHRGEEKGLKHFYFQEPEGRRRSDKTSGSRDFKHTKRKKIRRFENGNMWEMRF